MTFIHVIVDDIEPDISFRFVPARTKNTLKTLISSCILKIVLFTNHHCADRCFLFMIIIIIVKRTLEFYFQS